MQIKFWVSLWCSPINPLSRLLTIGYSTSTIQRVLQKNTFHLYKVDLHQELNDDDEDRRLQFCVAMTNLMSNQITSLE